MNHSEVARELAEAAKSVQAIWGSASLHPKPGDLIKMFNAAFLPILAKHFAAQPMAMEAVVERIAERVFEAADVSAWDEMHAREIVRAELAPVEMELTELREMRKVLGALESALERPGNTVVVNRGGYESKCGWRVRLMEDSGAHLKRSAAGGTFLSALAALVERGEA